VTVIAFRSPVRVPLLRFGTSKPTPPDPRAYDTFRVTQRFDDPDSINPSVKHRAVDIGNFRCGDTLVAMAPGVAYRVKDNAMAARGAPSDALGIRIDHGYGVLSEIWHMSQWLVENGSHVNAGQTIGSVGATGLGSVCHAHVEIKINGVRIDPEPMMFGSSLTIDSEDDDMRYSGSQLKVLDGAAQFKLNSAAHFRAAATRQSDSLRVFAAGTPIYPAVSIDGEQVGDNDQWVPCFMYTGAAYVWGYFHTSVVDAPIPPKAPEPVADPRVAKAIPHVRAALAELE
jgi:hypothetical protein